MEAKIFKNLIDKSQIPIVIFTEQKIEYNNSAFDQLLQTNKVSKESFITTHLSSETSDLINITSNGKNIYFKKLKLQIDEKHFAYQLIDITEQEIHLHNLENSLNSLNEIDRQRKIFLENLSHELRTPLTGIIGFTDLLKYTDVSPEALMYIESLSESANRMVETLNNINDFTLLTSENYTLQIQETDIFSTIKHVCDAFYYKAKAKNLKIQIKGEISPDNKFYTDAKKVETILKQLISNAIKFTEKGTIEVFFEADENKCVISVHDTGIGIPEDKIDECFEDFKQLSEGYNRHYEGSGIGLSIVKKLVHLLHGKIDVKSKINEGSTFTITLPNERSFEQKQEEVKTVDKKQGKNILYVEDNYLNQKLLQISLGKKFDITLADNAEQGLEWVKKKDFNLVLMDINLGKGMDGIQAMKEIKKIPKCAKTPIIALTAYALTNDEEKFLNAGFDDYIPKPYTKDEILSKISKFIYA